MKKLAFIILAAILYLHPFSCTPQKNGDCDTIIIEREGGGLPACQAMVEELSQINDSLTGINESLYVTIDQQAATIENQKEVIATQSATITAQTATIAERDATITAQGETITGLESDVATLTTDLGAARDSLQVCLDKPIEPGIPPNEVTEFTGELCWDWRGGEKNWIHEGDIELYPHLINLPFQGYGMLKVNFADSLTTFQKQFQTRYYLEETKNYAEAKTTYKKLDGVPLQFYIQDSLVKATANSLMVRTFQSEPTGIKYYINETEVDASGATPGEVTINNGTMYRHTREFTGLTPNTEYLLRFVITNGSETDEEEVIYRTTE